MDTLLDEIQNIDNQIDLLQKDIEYLERCGSNYHKMAMEQAKKNSVQFNFEP